MPQYQSIIIAAWYFNNQNIQDITKFEELTRAK